MITNCIHVLYTHGEAGMDEKNGSLGFTGDIPSFVEVSGFTTTHSHKAGNLPP
jgi:hypothetical protein